MNGYIKHFENGGKNMSFLIKNSELWGKYEWICNIIKNKLNIKFHSEPIYENKYLKTKVKEFDGNIKTNFLGNNLPKENTYYTCIACITMDSIIKMKKKDLFRWVQVQNKENKYTKIHKHWLRNRFWVRCRDRFRVKHNSRKLMIKFKCWL